MIKTNLTTEFDYEIMIVGGGPAGISTWLHLHKYFPELAEKTLLIEKATYPRDKLCGGAIGGWGNIILKQLGIEINVPSLWIDKIECIFENDIIYINEPKFFRMVRRTDFDHELAKVAIKRGLYLNEDEMFLDFKQGSHYLEIKTNLQKYKIKNLVGADGSLSKVRRKMNLNKKSNLAPTI